MTNDNSRIEWENEAPYAVCLSHDVDRIRKQFYHYMLYLNKGVKIQFDSFCEMLKGDEPYFNFYRIAEMEKEYNVKSTFFILNETHKELSPNFIGRYSINDPDLVEAVRYLDREGFEIGLHGSFYSYNDKELLLKEKNELEAIVGHEVVSSRQHFLNYSENTWQIQKEIGILYDSTIGNKKTTGENLPIFPYYTPEGVVEMPITVMDSVSLKNEEEIIKVIDACRNVANRGGLIMLNFHQRQLRTPEYEKVLDTYKRLIEMGLKDGAMFGRVCDFGRYFKNRIF